MKRQVVVLLLLPPLSGAYLLAMRAELVSPSYLAAAFFTTVPSVVLVAGASALRQTEGGERTWQSALIGLAALEVGWGLLTLAIVSFAIAWRLQ